MVVVVVSVVAVVADLPPPHPLLVVSPQAGTLEWFTIKKGLHQPMTKVILCTNALPLNAIRTFISSA